MKHIGICKVCGTSFTRNRPIRGQTCSVQCRGAARRRVQQRICIECKKPFECKPSYPSKHCSIQCFNKNRRGQTKPNMWVVCERCGKTFKRPAGHLQARFCSMQCYKPKFPRETRTCKECGVQFEQIKGATRSTQFCTHKCAMDYLNKHQKLDKHPSWRGGVTAYRRFRKDQCERCGSRRHLLVHHRDENRKNNDQSNLETLCKSCHQQHHAVRNKRGRYEKH